MSPILIEGAAQLLRPPADGLPYLRHDRAAELALDPAPVAIADGRIAGFERDDGAATRIDASGCAVIPGLVDCHTHLPFAGWRAEEYELKVTGVAYEEIARRGGGIASSARAFAQASDDEILAQARALRAEMLACGTTAFESKTGYGLSAVAEARAVRLGRELGADRVTGLFAHAVPDGYEPDAWMDEVDALAAFCDVDALDIYVESVAFANEHLERLGVIAAREGVALRAHVEQFNANRSVPVALAAGARSVDHLACLHPDDIGPLAAAECAAVLLPGAELMSDERTPPARELADAGAICALATDCNPGTSPIVSLPVIVGLAVRRYGWTALEVLRGDHQETLHPASERAQTTSPARSTRHTGLRPKRYGTWAIGESSSTRSARLPGSSEPSSPASPSTQAALSVHASSASRALHP